MRPIKLTMTAFGPFINTEVIDFKALGESPLFLINGTTGSGKTTILDAICFALYGQTTGNEREAMQMRCDFSADDVLTEVEFVFELAGKHYRISRIPEQSRNKTKGEGTTKQAAVATLSCINAADGADEALLVAKKVSDATRAIEELTGLKVDQFRQVMVLPQGKFRQLLMADSKDREVIFSQLFETHVYKRIEDKLKAKAKIVYKKIEELKDNQQGILQSVDFEKTEELDEVIVKLKPEVEVLKAEFTAKEMIHQDALKTFENAKELSQSFNQLKLQEEKLESLKLEEKGFDDKKEQLKLSDSALKIRPDFNILTKASASYAEALTLLNNIEQQFELAVKNLESAELEFAKNPQRSIELDKLKKQKVTLESYHAKGEALQGEKEKLKIIQSHFTKAELQCKKAKSDLEASIKNIEQSEKEKQTLENDLKAGSDLKLHLQTIESQISKRRSYETLQTQISSLTAEIKEVTASGKLLKAALDQSEMESKTLEIIWHKGQAAILAKELNTNHACPVCGSHEHPMPAQSDEALPTEQEREQSQKAVTLAREKVNDAREGYTNLTTRLKELNKQLLELQSEWNEVAKNSLVDLDIEQKRISLELNEFESKQKQLEVVLITINKIKSEQGVARANLEQFQVSLSELKAKREASLALVESAEKELPEEYRDLNTLKQSSLNVDDSITSLDKLMELTIDKKTVESNVKTEAVSNLKNQKNNFEKLKEELDQAKSSWELALSNSDFNDEDAYKNAHLNDEVRSTIKSSIEVYEKECQKLMGAIQHQSELLKNKIQPDIVLLEKHLERLSQEKQALDEQSKTKISEYNHFEKAQTTLQNLGKNQKAEEEEYKVIGTLSNVANGVTGNKISLQRFVLGVLLDDVLIDASQRLKMMSKGRYLLLRKEDRSKGNKASGLELEVEDSYTGKVRPVSTLSGGESFMASLSLALGLSEVVQAYAGGIHLDTLFIDEGFGSLDTDSLDLAIRTLTDLRDTGRMVGIISHVSELKEQIPLRLDVKTGDRGSYIELVN